MVTAEAVQEIVAAITPFIGENMARSATRVHCEKLGIAEPNVTPEQVELLIARLETGLRVFMGREKATSLMQPLRVKLGEGVMSRAIDRVLWPSLWAATLLFVGWGMVPHAALFTTVLPPSRLIAVAAIVKLTLLALGALWSWRARGSIDADNPVRPAWTLLAYGLLCNVIGQAALARYQLQGAQSPFPSAGDVFYILAYPLVGAALVRFVSAYHQAGYPMGSRSERIWLLAVTAAACAALSFIVLRPVVLAEMPPLEKALSAAYPLLDMALLVPLALLLRTTWHFRGGSVGTAWIVVLTGFVFMCAGDVLFAYFTALGQTGLDPFVHGAYILSYGLIAGGVRKHLALVTS